MYALVDVSNESCIKIEGEKILADFLCCYKSVDKIKKACKKYHNSLHFKNKNDIVTYKELPEHNCGNITYFNEFGEQSGNYVYYIINEDDLHRITQKNFMVKI